MTHEADGQHSPRSLLVELVAHRAGNTAATARLALGKVDMIELDVHVLRGRVEVRHAKVLRPTRRLWEKWYFLPPDATGVPIDAVLSALPPTTPLMIDLKCFTRRSAQRIMQTLPEQTPIVASTRNWWVLRPFRSRPNTRVLHSCGARWQLWWALRWSAFTPGAGVCVHQRRLTADVADALHARTPLVFCWGVTTPQRVSELQNLGITGVIADDYEAVANHGQHER